MGYEFGCGMSIVMSSILCRGSTKSNIKTSAPTGFDVCGSFCWSSLSRTLLLVQDTGLANTLNWGVRGHVYATARLVNCICDAIWPRLFRRLWTMMVKLEQEQREGMPSPSSDPDVSPVADTGRKGHGTETLLRSVTQKLSSLHPAPSNDWLERQVLPLDALRSHHHTAIAGNIGSSPTNVQAGIYFPGHARSVGGSFTG